MAARFYRRLTSISGHGSIMPGHSIRIIYTAEELAAIGGASCSFVPTMGALHAGHQVLIKLARASLPQRPVVVSIFVNPTQFGLGEDFTRYPRQLERDVELAADAGADIVFAPSVEVMYPPGEHSDRPPLPAVATQPGLEDACRPRHFAGVCQVVARLFDLVSPSIAVFGEKDYQQLRVVQEMVEQQRPRWGTLQIVPCQTLRESDGLAMSSRNMYLKPEQRRQALGLIRALEIARNASDAVAAEDVMRRALEDHGLAIDYAVVRDAETLMPMATPRNGARALIAARLGEVRLIDNASI